MVATVLLKNFVNEGKTTADKIQDCLEEARSYPIGRL